MIRRIWRSIVLRGPVIPRTDRDRAFVTIHTLVLHLRPVKVPARAIRFTHTFGLGGSSFVLIGLLVLSGLLLTIGYEPSPDTAYASIVRLERDVTFGPLVRGVHYWAANLLVIVLGLHAVRVLLTGGYHGPRQFNWVVGVSLLGLVLANAFTGYLLPWDQLSYWAITISTGMLAYVPLAGETLQRAARSGADIGAPTLVLYYAIHTSLIPALIATALALHFWRVRKAGGVVLPPGDEDARHTVTFVPHLLLREFSLAMMVVAAVVLLAAAAGAPLGQAANPGMSPNPAKAPWYFMGLQELLVHLHPAVAVFVLPAAGVMALLLLPYVTDDDEPSGSWGLSPRARRAAVAAALVALVATPAAVIASDALSRWRTGAPGFLAGGVAPLALAAAAGFALVRTLRIRLALGRNETAQTIAVLCLTAFAVLTAVGIWFRGPGMALVWPWHRGH